MKSIREWKQIIQSDSDIKNLIANSEALRSNYGPRPWSSGRKQVHTHASVMADRLWKSLEGVQLKILLETRYGYRGSNQERGAIKDALCVYLSEQEDAK